MLSDIPKGWGLWKSPRLTTISYEILLMEEFLYQLRLVVYPIIYEVLCIPGGDRRISSINCRSYWSSLLGHRSFRPKYRWIFISSIVGGWFGPALFSKKRPVLFFSHSKPWRQAQTATNTSAVDNSPASFGMLKHVKTPVNHGIKAANLKWCRIWPPSINTTHMQDT